MEGKRRNVEDIQDSLVVQEEIIVKFLLAPIANLKLLLKGFFFQEEEVKGHHCRDTQRPNIMNYLLTPETPDHLPLATLPCLPEQCNHCVKNFSRNSSLSKHMVVVQRASCPSKKLQDRYLAKLMARRRISFVICYIAFNTRISLKKHMKRVHHCNKYEKSFKSLQMPNQHIIWQHSGNVFVCKQQQQHQQTKEAVSFQASPQEFFLQLLHVGQGGGEEKDILYNPSWKYIIYLFHTQNYAMFFFRL